MELVRPHTRHDGAATANTARRASHRRTGGLSVLEVVIAMGILSFGLLAAAASQLAATRFNRDSHLKTEAAYLAEQQMEAFQAMDGDGIEAVRTDPGYPNDPGNPIDPDPNDGVARNYVRSWTITPDAPESGVYTLSVVVSWVDRMGITRNVTLKSVKTDT